MGFGTGVCEGGEMRADKIREQKLEGAGGVNYSAHYERDCAIFLRELAAQAAELNDKLKIILNPPLIYDTKTIDPSDMMGFSDDLPHPIFTMNEPRATLRDQFAMAALTGLLSDPTSSGPKGCAEAAYSYADAMMERRK